MEITKLNLESEDIVQNNIEQLKQLFPEIVTEGKIDFYKLKEVLGDEIDDEDENMNLHGMVNMMLLESFKNHHIVL